MRSSKNSEPLVNVKALNRGSLNEEDRPVDQPKKIKDVVNLNNVFEASNLARAVLKF